MMFYLVARFLRQAGWSDWDVLQLRADATLVWLVFRPEEGNPTLVGKLDMNSGGAEHARRACATLAYLAPFAEHLGIPRIVAQQETEWGVFQIQTAVPGKPLPTQLSPFDDRLIAAQFDLVEPWLERFQTVVPRQGSADSALRERLLTLPHGGAPEAVVEAAINDLPLLAMVPSVAVHGDFFGSNVLVAGGRVSIVDWSTFHYGAPLEDLFSFAAGSVVQWEHEERSEDVIWSVFFGPSPLAARTRKAATRTLARLQLPHSLLRPMFLMYLIDRAGRGAYYCRDVRAWTAVAARYVAAGMPDLWTGM